MSSRQASPPSCITIPTTSSSPPSLLSGAIPSSLVPPPCVRPWLHCHRRWHRLAVSTAGLIVSVTVISSIAIATARLPRYCFATALSFSPLLLPPSLLSPPSLPSPLLPQPPLSTLPLIRVYTIVVTFAFAVTIRATVTPAALHPQLRRIFAVAASQLYRQLCVCRSCAMLCIACIGRLGGMAKPFGLLVLITVSASPCAIASCLLCFLPPSSLFVSGSAFRVMALSSPPPLIYTHR